jgi:hypothetical protein
MTPRHVMLGLLALAGALVLISLWRAHRSALLQFNLFDLITENGKVSKIAVSYMLVLGVTTWVIVWLTVRDKLTEGYFTAYGALWVAPLVAKVVFNKDVPASSTSTTIVQQTEVTKP